MKKAIGLIFVLVILVAANSGLGQESQVSETTEVAVDTVIVSAGGQMVQLTEFRRRYINHLLSTGLADTPLNRNGFAEMLVSHYLLLEDAIQGDIESLPAYKAEKARVTEKMFIEAWRNKEVYADISVTETDLENMFIRMNTQVHARHLFAPTLEAASALQERLSAGETFSQLAQEIFVDSALANNGGDLGFFSFDEMDPGFEASAMTLEVGKISNPVQTAQGYSIIKVEERLTQPLMTQQQFVRKREKMRQFVLRKKRLIAVQSVTNEIVEDLNIQYQTMSFIHLVTQIQGENTLTTEEERETWLSSPLLSFNVDEEQQVWTVAEFRTRASQEPAEHRAQIRDVESLKAFVSGLLVRDEIIKQAKSEGYADLAEFSAGVKDGMARWIHSELKNRWFANWNPASDQLESYFTEHQENYRMPTRVNLHEIVVESKVEADEILAGLNTGNFESIAKRKSRRPGADQTGGNLGLISREEVGVLADKIFAGEANSIIGPIEAGGWYMLLWIGEKESSRPMTFNESRYEIFNIVQQSSWENYRRENDTVLRQKYPIQINTEVIQNIKLSSSN